MRIMSDFDSTLIVQNSLNIMSRQIFNNYMRNHKYMRLLKSVPVLWIRIKEVFVAKTMFPEFLVLDDSDLVIRKAKKLKGVPYSIYCKETVPLLDINATWILACLRLKKEFKKQKEKVTIVTRNGIDETEFFLESKATKVSRDILNDKSLISTASQLRGKTMRRKKVRSITNRKVLEYFGIKLDVIANKFVKRPVVVDGKKDQIYTGVVKNTHPIGIIEVRNKAILYENNVVIADKEEKMYAAWTKKFVNVEK